MTDPLPSHSQASCEAAEGAAERPGSARRCMAGHPYGVPSILDPAEAGSRHTPCTAARLQSKSKAELKQ